LDADYRFHITGDDETLLFLSSSERSDNGELVASVPGWTKVGEFNKYSSQSPDLKTLESGRRYYFEIRFKEGGGNDHFTVAWEGPGFARSVVPSNALHSWAPAAAEPGMSIQEAYHLGYKVGFLDAGASISFDPSFPPRDEDGDGIPDGIEVGSSLDPLDSADAQQDKDSDGYSNLKEYHASTDLNSANETPLPEDSQQYLAGFVGQYFRGINFDQLVVVKNEPGIDFDWGGGSPSGDLPSDDFSARWVGKFTAPHDEGEVVYRFTTRTDDGVRLFLAGRAVIDVWQNQAAASYSHEVTLEPGELVPVAMEYYEKGGGAVAQMSVVETSTGASVDYGSVFRAPDPSPMPRIPTWPRWRR